MEISRKFQRKNKTQNKTKQQFNVPGSLTAGKGVQGQKGSAGFGLKGPLQLSLCEKKWWESSWWMWRSQYIGVDDSTDYVIQLVRGLLFLLCPESVVAKSVGVSYRLRGKLV